jgi:hypothetical protein
MYSSNTYQVTLDLDNYLKDNGYFDGEDEAVVNQRILVKWDKKFKSAVAADIKSKFGNIKVDFVISKFELNSGENQGACLFFQTIIFNDIVTLEFINAFIKTVVNYNKTSVYLDSNYATVDKWQGKSKQLKNIFNRLKTSDKNFSYFNPISLTELVK